MHYERLERLAALLDTVPPEKFDLGSWACGTTACAIGWAALDPTFRNEGFRLEVEYFVPLFGTRRRADATKLSHTNVSWRRLQPDSYPVFGGYEDYEAVMLFFGLSKDQAHRLFDRAAYGNAGTATDVAKRIRAMLARSKRAKAKQAPRHEPEVVRALASVD